MRRNRYGVPFRRSRTSRGSGTTLRPGARRATGRGGDSSPRTFSKRRGRTSPCPSSSGACAAGACGAKGLVELRISVRAARRHGPGGAPALLPNAARLVARTLKEAQPASGREAEALADAVVKTLYAAGYL